VGEPLGVLLSESVPQGLPAPEHEVPEMVQETPLFCESFVTVAVNCTWVLTCTPVGSGLGEVICTEIAIILNVTWADFVGSPTEVAVTVTELVAGALDGAV